MLNRLNICGEINSNTPQCVLEEICTASSIKYNITNESPIYINKIINKIYSHPGEYISENYENNVADLRVIARFINAEHREWRRETLIKAYSFLTCFEDENVCKMKRIKFDFGPQTSFSPRSLNCCVLYKICKTLKIRTYFATTINEMASFIKLYFLDDHLIINAIKASIYDTLRFNSNNLELINILSLTDPTFSSDIIPIISHNEGNNFVNNITYDEYSRIADEIQNREEKLLPTNHEEAIVMSALYHKLDISKCQNPMNEYQLVIKTPYFPHDKNLKKRLSQSYVHPDFLQNPHLDVVFNPNFPVNMYSEFDLEKLCVSEGLKSEDGYYTSLQMTYLTENFIHGKQGNIINTTTTFLEDVKDLTIDDVVVYGVRCENRNIMRAFTYGELYDTFTTYKRFTNPSTNELFSDESIEKLYLLTQKERRRFETDENYRDRIDLGEEIERIRIYINSQNKCLEEFLSRYENCQEDDRRRVEKVLISLLHCGMYMRNWDGVGNFPLTSEQTNYNFEQQIIIDDRVTQSLIEFEKSCLNLNDLNRFGDFILNMPLMQYNFDSNVFITINDENEGLTIRDRIRIVRRGEDESGIVSCIRLSSNKFCATSYYYMVLIGFRLPFNISEISYIY